ncbi:MAG: thiamine diphosphokinase [Calditrichia bacterium]|nr:thiamine diphosphokinase [Calditrichia bacterium]
MNNNVALFLNAPLPPEKILEKLLPEIEDSFIICADGGYLFAKKLPIKIDKIIGDLDTIKKANVVIPREVEIIEKPSQELNDFEKALIYLKGKGIKKIFLFGLTGERTDHVLANLSVLSRYIDDFSFEIYGQEAKVYFLTEKKKKLVFKTKIGCQISLIPLPNAEEIYTSGLKYPLKNGALRWGIKEGSSNEAIDETVEIKIAIGQLVVFENYYS